MARSADSLRKEIEAFLRENPKSPAAGSLRSAVGALGEPSPGERAAREAGSGDQEDRKARGLPSDLDSKPNTPGRDMDTAKPPGKSDNPFGGIKKSETAKQLARLRFKQKGKK